jgi:hypothetical protein
LPKKAKASVEGDLRLKQSPEQREIAALTQQLKEQSDEAAHFRIPLPAEIRSEARALAVRACALDAQAERRLRDIAREHRWLFRSLCEDLGGDNSGGPDRAADQDPSFKTAITDEGSAAGATGETIAHAPKSEESPSDEAGAEREEGDSSGASGVTAAVDNLGNASPLEDDRARSGDGAHGAKLATPAPILAEGKTPERGKAVVVEYVRRGKKRPHVDAWWKREPDRPSPAARDVGKIPR